MSFAEALAQAFKLFVVVVSYAFEQAKKREQRIADWQLRQEAFERMVTQALLEMRSRAQLERKQIDVVDDAVDNAIGETHHGKTRHSLNDLQQRSDDPGGPGPTSGNDGA